MAAKELKKWVSKPEGFEAFFTTLPNYREADFAKIKDGKKVIEALNGLLASHLPQHTAKSGLLLQGAAFVGARSACVRPARL